MNRRIFILLYSLFLLQSMEISLQAEPCRHDQVSVRLVNGTSGRDGRVELCWNYQWKAVCDSGWDQAEAITVCRELGYFKGNGRVIALSGSHFGDAREIHQLKQWNCGPTDTTLAYCRKSSTRQPCGPLETAGVHCLGTNKSRAHQSSNAGGSNCQDWEIRLVHRETLSKGTVEICLSGVWGAICDDGWDDNDARVTCQQLGYFQGYATLGNTREEQIKQHLGHISCTGQELRLMDCSHEGIGVDTCGLNSNKTAAVECVVPPTQAIRNKSTVTTSGIAQPGHNNSSSEVPLTRNPSIIIAGCTCGGIVLLTVIVSVPMIMVFIRKRRQQHRLVLKFDKPSMHHEDTPIHIYDEITTFTATKVKDTSNTTTTTSKTEQGMEYETSSTAIPTTSNQAYGFLQREKS